MTIIVPTSMTAYLYLYSHGEVSLAASQPVQYLLCTPLLAFSSPLNELNLTASLNMTFIDLF